MSAPATTGKLCTTIQEMKIGDYIACKANTNATPIIYEIGTKYTTEIPYTGFRLQFGTSTGNMGIFYFIKVDKGLLIADRVIYNSFKWDDINGMKWVQGKPRPRDGSNEDFGIDGIIRSLTGGVAYADANGNKATTDQGYGAWPTNNEWDKYIVNFPQELIQPGKTLNDIFHVNYVVNSTCPITWCQDTPVNGIKNVNNLTSVNTHRTCRMFMNGTNKYHFDASNLVTTNIGFRPVFEYKEV